MTMNALATTNGNTLSIPSNETFDVLYRIAQVGSAAASMTKRKLDPGEAMYIILHGYALNIDPMVALNDIFIVNGKPSCSAQLMIALANKAGVLSQLTIPDPGEVTDSATVVAVRKDRRDDEYRATFTMDMARAAGLSEKDNWKKHQGAMLVARAVSACLRKAVPEAIAGMYTVEEINSDVIVDDEGTPSAETPRIIAGEIAPQSSPVPPYATGGTQPETPETEIVGKSTPSGDTDQSKSSVTPPEPTSGPKSSRSRGEAAEAFRNASGKWTVGDLKNKLLPAYGKDTTRMHEDIETLTGNGTVGIGEGEIEAAVKLFADLSAETSNPNPFAKPEAENAR